MYSRNSVITLLAFYLACFAVAAAEIESLFYPVRTQVLRKNNENEGRLLQGQDKNRSSMSRNVVDEGGIESQLLYKVGTPVSIKKFDGSWTNGKITKANENGYTIKWDHGEIYVIGLEDGELDQMVENSIAQGNTSKDEDEDTGYVPSEMIETTKSSNWTKESTITLFFVVTVLAVVWYVRHKKLVAISSTRKSEGGIWGNNVQNGTTLSLQMDEHRNLRSVRSIV